MVIPSRSLRAFPRVSLSNRLTPVFTIHNEELLLETPKMGAIPQRVLREPVSSLAFEQDQIMAALDFLSQGY
jgi:toxin CcdB